LLFRLYYFIHEIIRKLIEVLKSDSQVFNFFFRIAGFVVFSTINIPFYFRILPSFVYLIMTADIEQDNLLVSQHER